MSKQEQPDELDIFIQQAFANIRNSVLSAVIDTIKHEIALTGDGQRCLTRIQRLYNAMKAVDAAEEKKRTVQQH